MVFFPPLSIMMTKMMSILHPFAFEVLKHKIQSWLCYYRKYNLSTASVRNSESRHTHVSERPVAVSDVLGYDRLFFN